MVAKVQRMGRARGDALGGLFWAAPVTATKVGVKIAGRNALAVDESRSGSL